MIMGAGLDRTGVLNKAASAILRMAQGVEGRLSLLINAMAGSLSSILQSQALAALFLPVVFACRRARACRCGACCCPWRA